MKELNELFSKACLASELGKKGITVDLTMLSQVRDEFRALEQESQKNLDGALAWQQRAEAAEAKLAEEKRINSKLRQERADLSRECNAFEAKLAELQRQEPLAWTSQANLDTLKSEHRKTLEFMTGDKSIYSNPVPLFTRPAPAFSLAEVVPNKIIRGDEDIFDVGFANGFNACRAAVLLNIEEQSQ